MSNDEFNKKTALITGGAGGIGLAIAQRLAADGTQLILLGRNQEKGDAALALLTQTGATVEFHSVDIGNQENLSHAMEQILQNHPQIDILVNNAALSGFTGPVLETPAEALDSVLAVNLVAPFLITQFLLPGMKKAGYGRIINISSVAPRVNPPHSVTYNMSKAGLNSFTASLSREVAAQGITVNAIAPGLVLTNRIKDSRLPSLAKESGRSTDEVLQAMTSRCDTKRLTTEEELADAAAFLCTPSARNITGQILEMSGGY
ncbi:MAG: SDR family oxidoreductase [Spirochaetales bacterium]|nr:SDR family oxidoreductase [Spirochaetales bacterium]